MKQQHHTQLTNCDWLSFSVLMTLSQFELANEPILTTPDGYILKNYGGTNLYRRRAILYTIEGDKVLTLLYQPHSQIIDIHSLFVEVANRLLYTGFDHILDLLFDVHPYTWQSLSRLDIATDFNPTQSQTTIIDMLQAGTAYVAGKREGSMFHDYRQGGTVKRQARCISWGSKHSDVRFKLYNKTLELYDQDDKGRRWCNKPYIESQWRRHNLDINNVWRLEVSIMGAASYDWRGHRLDWSITEPQAMAWLYYDLVAKRFVVRKNEGHTNKRYDTILDFLEIPDVEHCRIAKREAADAHHHTDHAATMRNLMKELDKPETQCNRQITATLLSALETVIQSAHLQGYFLRATGKIFDDWAEEFCAALPSPTCRS